MKSRVRGLILLAGVGVSLVNVHYHWYSDLPLGIAVGYLFGRIVSHGGSPVSPLTEERPGGKLLVMPALQDRGAGLAVAMVF